MPACSRHRSTGCEPFGLDADYFIDVPRHADQMALITTKAEGVALAQSLGAGFAVLLANHGVTFCGTSVPHATCVGVFLEKACKAQLAGQAAGFRTVDAGRCHARPAPEPDDDPRALGPLLALFLPQARGAQRDGR